MRQEWHNENGTNLTLPGPWQDEPDKVQWVDEATDLDCLLVRNHLGTWCGYVGVPPGHPWHGKSYHDITVDVHGGLTYASSCDEDALEGEGICHIPEPGRQADVWWLGFDCGHAFDLAPGMLQFERERFPGEEVFERLAASQTYRDINYAEKEVRHLAHQIAQVT